MNGILGFISLLQEPGLNGEEQEEYIDIVKKSGERLLSTIHDIVDISKIESGLMPVSSSEIDLHEIMGNLYSFFKREAEAKGLRLVLTKDNWTTPDTITTDREKLNSVLSNLIKNALKFTNEGTVEFGYLIEGDFIEFKVKDTGIGVPENRKQAIFERFVQADISHSRPYEGAGLGLSISKAFVEMLGGRIWLESIKGQGSAFFFRIPCSQTQESIEDASSVSTFSSIGKNERTGQKRMKIMVSEDDEVNFHFVNLLLKKAGHTVIHAATGTEAIEICRQTPDIDMILMDIRLPDINGYDATREIRKFNMDIPIIALTAFAFESDREKALQSGCNDYLSKPVKKDELLETMKKFQL
jgi:CheY-like chemotaxis protein